MTTTTPSLRKILVIEDEGDMCLLLELLLTARNVNVNHAKTLSQAQECLKLEQPDLVLLDNRLPDGFGVDFIDHIKKNYPDVKIVLITGVDRAIQDFALEAGADTFLSKPFTRQQLHHCVDDLLN
ncbi:MAG: response regulator [Bacteroidetes bacterium]|nr:response regulator [Bacteroidota bacterium]